MNAPSSSTRKFSNSRTAGNRQFTRECYRVLKPGYFCAILIGDTRRNLHYVPVAFRTLHSFLEVGFILREDIIKHQWQCKSTPYGPKNLRNNRDGKFFGKRNLEGENTTSNINSSDMKKSMESNFLMIMHEHLFVFRKPKENEKLKKYEESMA